MSTATQTPETGLIKVDEAGKTIIASLSDAMPYNQKLRNLALDAFRPVLDTIEAEGMNAELDKQLNDLIVRGKSAKGKMEDRRKPGTQLMSRLVKVFTGFENEVEAIIEKAQQHRNSWAKQCAEDQRKREQEILRKQNAEKERISLQAEIERQIREQYNNKLYEFKRFYSEKLNTATLEKFEDVSKVLKDIKTLYPRDKFRELSVNVNPLYMDKKDLAGLIFDTRESLYDELSANFRENMEVHQQQLIDLLPSKKAELERMKRANKEEQERIAQEAEQRRIAEEQRLKDEAAEQRRKDEQQIELNKNINTASTLFDSQAELAEVAAPAGKVRQGYSIEVLAPDGYGAIFLFWYEKAGQTLAVADMGKKSLDQMKTFCEKYAHSQGEKITHKSIVYHDEFKAVNTKN